MATTYRIQFNNFEEQAVEATITNDAGSLGTIDIEGAEDAVRIVSQDNDESKYSPIKAKKCVIKFLNSQSVALRTFATGEDNSWLVTVKINSLTVFIGYLEQGDIEEPFQYEENEIVVLTATDGLGALKSRRLDDIYNVWTPDNLKENRIIDYIAACLGATGLELTINVINNLREEDNDDTTDPTTFGNIYATLYLNIKTWEDDQVGRYLNSYDILERILKDDCYLTQAKGEWWIVRVKELRPDFDMKKTVFDFDGTIVSFETLNYEKAIGLKDVSGTPFAASPDASAFFSQDKTVASISRPFKSVALKYNYDNPFEILCNQAFERGAFIADLADEVDPDGITLQAKSYEVDCWTYEKGVPLDVQDSDVYIERLFSLGQEKQRFVHFPETATNAFYYLVCNERIPVQVYDKFTLSFNVRYNTDFGSPSGEGEWEQAWVRLYADDGTFWSLNAVSGTASAFFDTATYWQATAADWLGSKVLRIVGEASSIDFTQWQSLSFDSPPMPRSGKLEIILINQDVTDTRTKDYGAINFEYIPYINGNYNTFSSQTDTSTRDGDYFSSIEDEVFIANAPTPVFKGALLKKDGSDFPLVGRFYDGQEYDSGTGPGFYATYGELRVRAYHQQFRNGDEIYRATCQGLTEGSIDTDSLDDHQDVIHRYFIRDIEPTTNTQAFQLVTQDVDLRNCEWTGTLIKNFDTGIGYIIDTYAFSYDAQGSGPGGGGSGGGGGATATGDRFGVSGEDDTAGEPRTFSLASNPIQIDEGSDDVFSIIPSSFQTFLAAPPSLGLNNAQVILTAVNGVNVSAKLYSNASGPSAYVTADGLLGKLILFGYNGIQFFTYGAGTLTTDASGNVTAVSDVRLKDIQGEYKSGIDSVMQINPILYRWNKESGLDQDHSYIGFSAQNIQTSIGSEAVGIDSKGYLSIQDRAIMATMVNSIKHLYEKVKELENKITELENNK